MAARIAACNTAVPAPSLRAKPVTVYVAVDDRDTRAFLTGTLRRDGYDVVGCPSAEQLLSCCDPSRHGCLLIDVRLPDMDGLTLREKLLAKCCRQPFIMMSAHNDVPAAVDSLRRGAIDFLVKPFGRVPLLESVASAARRDRRRRSVQDRLDALTDRERQVLALVACGRATKEIARTLNVSSRTVESHRSRITKKMQVDSVAELVYLLSKHEQYDV